MKKSGLMVLCILLLIGCATTQTIQLDKATSTGLKGKAVILVKNEKPSFVAMTSGKGMFALVGATAAISAGNALVEEKKIEDPAMRISERLSPVLITKYGLTSKGQSETVPQSTDVNAIAKLSGDSDYALDVASTGWGFIYDGFKFSEYIITYSTKLRLVDVANAKVLSEGACAYSSKNAGKPNVSYEKLMENDAEYIKETLLEAAEYCAAKFQKDLFPDIE